MLEDEKAVEALLEAGGARLSACFSTRPDAAGVTLADDGELTHCRIGLSRLF